MPGHRKFSDEKILYFLYRIFLCFVQYIYPWNRPFCYRMRFKVSPRQLPICLFSKPTGKKPNCKCQYTNDHPSKAIRHPNKHDSRFDSFDAGIFWPFESHHFLGFPAYLLNLVQVEIVVSRYGIGNLTPGSDQGFLLFLHTRSEQKETKYPCKMPFHGAKVANIL